MKAGRNLSVEEIVTCLREHDIQPSAQRVAVAKYVLQTEEHPSAESVLSRIQPTFPMISRATVYNTLHLFVERGLLREVKLGTSSVVYDSNIEKHHHLIDEETGEIHDIPWDSVDVSRMDRIEGFEIQEYQVVIKGRRERSH